MLRPLTLLLGAGLLALPAAVAVPTAAGAAGPATAGTVGPATPASVTVVHGVRGLVADVRIDDRLVLSGFAPERVTDPLSLPPGSHHVQAWPTGAAADSAPVVDQVLTVTPGEQATAAIGLSAAGKPVITVYDDRPLLPTGGSTALAVRGLARTDPVEVVAGDRTLAPALTPTQQQVAQVSPGTYAVSVRASGGSAPVVPPQDVPVSAGRATVLYLIGSQSDSTLGWVAQTVRPPSAQSAPLRVDTGVGPLPDTSSDPGVPVVLALVVLVPAAGVAARRLARAR